MSNENGKPTPFTQTIKDAGGEQAYWMEWNGFQTPVIVADYMAEVASGRENLNVMEISGFQKMRVSGEQAGEFLDFLCTRSVSGLSSGRVAYVVLANEDGLFLDDATVFCLKDNDYLVLSAGDLLEWANEHSGRFDITTQNVQTEWCALSIYGPKSYAYLEDAGVDGLNNLKAFNFVKSSIGGVGCIVSRTSFSGDLGYEIFAPWSGGEDVIAQLMTNAEKGGLRFAGVGAVDVLRSESGYLLPGFDFPTPGHGEAAEPSAYRTPFDLGLDWLIELDRENFIGKEALSKEKARGSRLNTFALQLSPEVEAEIEEFRGFDIRNEKGEVIGSAFAGGFSLTFGGYIGLCTIDRGSGNVDDTITVGDEKWPGVLKKSPMFTTKRRTQTPPPV